MSATLTMPVNHSGTFALGGSAPAASISVEPPESNFLTAFVKGTGSVLSLSRVKSWKMFVESSIQLEFQIDDIDSRTGTPDLRTATDHLGKIRSVLNPAVADLAKTFNVSRQAIYKWINGESKPEIDNLMRIQELSQVADRFAGANIQRASALLKMKAFDGQSLLDLIAANQLTPEHVELLVSEAQAMQGAYERSGLARSKAAPTSDWKSSHSVPGTAEG